MGYELSIVRQTDYSNEEEESNISMEEWLLYVAGDPELTLTNGYALNIPGVEQTWQDRPGFCEWTGSPPNEEGVIPWFDYGYGSITAKYPNDDTIRKMVAIANHLKGKVRGDSFEYYDENYFINGRPTFLDE